MIHVLGVFLMGLGLGLCYRRLIKFLTNHLYQADKNVDSTMCSLPVIAPKDAASALVHKSLRHLVNGCETHMAICPYKEESLDGVIAFAKEVLSRDMASTGIMRMANLEDQLLQSQAKYNELLKIAQNSGELEQYLQKECFCGTKSRCRQHAKELS